MISSKYFLCNGNYSLVPNSNLSNNTNTWNSKLYNFPYRCKHFSLVGTNFESNNVFIHVSKISSTACMDTSLYQYHQGSVFYRCHYSLLTMIYGPYNMRHFSIIQNRSQFQMSMLRSSRSQRTESTRQQSSSGSAN